MKNIFNRILVYSLPVLLVLFGTSCVDDEPLIYTGPSLAHFPTASANFTVERGDNMGYNLVVGVTAAEPQDRTFNFVVNTTSSTAIEGVHVSFPSKSVVIPAGEVLGTTKIEGIFENLDEPVSLVLNLVEDASSASFRQSFTLNLNRFCSSELAGTWSGTTVLSSPTGTISNYELTLTATSTNGVYTLSDITGGLYTLGYGASDNPVTLVDVCGELSVSDQPDVVYGGDVFNATGTVNQNGSLTLSWSNGYGDAGVTTFVRP